MRQVTTIMFHSVGLNKHQWVYPHISIAIEAFEKRMAALRKAGCRSVFFVSSEEVTDPKNAVCLTFDDGYLDNWVHVFPVLEKYNIKATIFVNPEFVDPRDIVRPQSTVGKKGSDHKADGCCDGFLSWAEMREMERSGLVDIQSHALTHTWYFKGPRIVDYWYPGAATDPEGPVWMLWNRFPEYKPYYLSQAAKIETRLPYGTPIYEHGKSLETRQFFPDRFLDEFLCGYVRDNGDKRFFDKAHWRRELDTVVEQYKKNKLDPQKTGQIESKTAYYDRVRHELTESKKNLEQNLNKRILGICWPGGGVNKKVLEIACDVGYKFCTLPSKWKAAPPENLNVSMISRMGSMPTTSEFIWQVRRHQGSVYYKALARFAILLRYGRSLLK